LFFCFARASNCYTSLTIISSTGVFCEGSFRISSGTPEVIQGDKCKLEITAIKNYYGGEGEGVFLDKDFGLEAMLAVEDIEMMSTPNSIYYWFVGTAGVCINEDYHITPFVLIYEDKLLKKEQDARASMGLYKFLNINAK